MLGRLFIITIKLKQYSIMRIINRSLLHYSSYSIITGGILGTAYSLHNNEYRLDSVAAVRVGKAFLAVLRIAHLYRTHMYECTISDAMTTEEYQVSRSRCHRAGAEILLQLCQANRGVYIKVGQHLAALEYMIPSEYTDTLRVLHSCAPTSSLADVYRVIREDFHCADPLELFQAIDTEPLGAASLAQVHRAYLRADGRPVALKVQHAHVRGNATVDLFCMEALVWIVSCLFSEFRFQWIVDETRRNIPQELDFSLEGRNAERAAQLYCVSLPWLRIPAIYWKLSSQRVLTMELIEGGGQVNDLQYMQRHGIDTRQLSNRLGLLYAHMMFVHGFVHADPHPGNIHVLPDGQQTIVLLDHGLYATLSDRFRADYAHFWLSILHRDRIAMRRYSERLGVAATSSSLYGLFACMVAGRTWEGIMGTDSTKKIRTVSGSAGNTIQLEREALRNELPNLLPQITNVLDTVDRQMLLVLKTNDLLRGIEFALRTYGRQEALNAMALTCISCVYAGRLSDKSLGVVQRALIRLSRTFALMRLRTLHIALGLRTLIATYLNFIISY